MNAARPTVVSLFSGAGGLDIGLERAGWRIVSATDNDARAVETLRASQAARISIEGTERVYLEDTLLIERDVSSLAASSLRPAGAAEGWRPDLLAGGPPCQPWSSAGLQRGLADPRGQLIAHYLRLVDELRPRFVLFENVQGLVTARGESGTPGEVLRDLQRDLKEIGYASRVATLNAADYGAAQRRVRLMLIATAEYELPDFPVATHSKDPVAPVQRWVTLREVLSSMPEPAESDVVRPSGQRAEALRELSPGTGLKTTGRVMANRPSGQWGYRQDAFLADLDLPSRTIRAAGTPDWVRLPGDSDLRRLTWRECAVLQGFPEEWVFSGTASHRFRQIGNAVQTDVARALGVALLAALSGGVAETPPVTPAWPAELTRRVRYTSAEARVNGHLRVRDALAS